MGEDGLQISRPRPWSSGRRSTEEEGRRDGDPARRDPARRPPAATARVRMCAPGAGRLLGAQGAGANLLVHQVWSDVSWLKAPSGPGTPGCRRPSRCRRATMDVAIHHRRPMPRLCCRAGPSAHLPGWRDGWRSAGRAGAGRPASSSLGERNEAEWSAPWGVGAGDMPLDRLDRQARRPPRPRRAPPSRRHDDRAPSSRWRTILVRLPLRPTSLSPALRIFTVRIRMTGSYPGQGLSVFGATAPGA